MLESYTEINLSSRDFSINSIFLQVSHPGFGCSDDRNILL